METAVRKLEAVHKRPETVEKKTDSSKKKISDKEERELIRCCDECRTSRLPCATGACPALLRLDGGAGDQGGGAGGVLRQGAQEEDDLGGLPARQSVPRPPGDPGRGLTTSFICITAGKHLE